MKSGIELIAEERQEQIEKHGWNLQHDRDYGKGELIKAALFATNPEVFEWPFYWDESFRNKILKKTKVEQLRVAGALIAAEIDRLQSGLPADIDAAEGREYGGYEFHEFEVRAGMKVEAPAKEAKANFATMIPKGAYTPHGWHASLMATAQHNAAHFLQMRGMVEDDHLLALSQKLYEQLKGAK